MSPRKQRIALLFNEGLCEIDKLGLVTHDPDRFFLLINFRTGLTSGAFGGVNAKGAPYIYIGTRSSDFDKEQALRESIAYRGRQSNLKKARERAEQGEWQYVEYCHINDDLEIGAFVSDDSDDHLRALVAHELAHAIHWWIIEQGGTEDKTVHGESWQRIYQSLRRNWVNPKINANK